MIGDIIGKPGRRAIRETLPNLRHNLELDIVVANGENTAGGFGITPETAQELLESGVDVITTGNHIWKQKDIIPYLNEEWPILRPANYPSTAPGRGHITLSNLTVVNIMGRVFMNSLDCPFRTMDQILSEIGQLNASTTIIVDFHAEATSEKQALGWYLDGKVSAVVGTHTHVGTSDCRILPNGTAYLTDVGMCGPYNSVIGCEIGPVIEGFVTQMPKKFTIPDGPVLMNAVQIDIDDSTGKATNIQRIDKLIDL